MWLPSFSIAVVASPTETPPDPIENSAPVISGTPPTTAVEGQVYSFRPTATDADGDVLRFSVANRPAWASFDSATGRLSGTPTSGDVAQYSNIVISVTDGEKSASLAPFSIAVVSTTAGAATLSWDPPTTKTDGSPLLDLAGFRLMWGTTSGSYPNSVTIRNPGVTQYVVEDLAPGTYYFVVVAFDSEGAESDHSNAAQATIPTL